MVHPKLTKPQRFIVTSIGSTFPNSIAKLMDIPEMNYLSTDITAGEPTPRGEIMLKGPAVSPGYLREPELTKETFTEDGWVHTGDIGKLLPEGYLTIIDRKKHIFKLAQVNYLIFLGGIYCSRSIGKPLST